ncbi:hypothetical protein BDN70DRAFT_432938 [Pholiota conissans]|uniref:Uncharacterized protein n=1 Tax=Pholiota conissans TaxID=109636 RepID=A0A9P6CU84_9AGAR|nr:hypothetical protein BDN70DRAFT_432938 [Pholiota conissans]
MIMQINGPVAPPLPYIPLQSTPPSMPVIPSAEAPRRIHSVRRVLSSPTKDHNRPRGPSDPSADSRQRSYPRYTTNGHEHEWADDYLPAFLRDQQSSNTKNAIKQMAEHRVLLEARKRSSSPSSSSEFSEEDESEDDYAWYLQNPHRYVRRPRDRSAKKQRRRMVPYGDTRKERDDEDDNNQTNMNLFAAYFLHHYGVTLFWGGEGCPDGACRRLSAAERVSAAPRGGPRAYWDDPDASDEDGETLFWVDEDDLHSSPTLGNASIRHPKCSEELSSDAGRRDSLLSDDLPIIKALPSTSLKNEGKRSSFFRTNTTRVRSGSHRRFSFLRIFSS